MLSNDEQLTEIIIGAAMKVLNTLKPGLDEKLYERALVIELNKQGLSCDQQKQFSVRYDEQLIGNLIPDLIVEGKVIVDPKVVTAFNESHYAQMLGYLNITGLKTALLLNFKHLASRSNVSPTDTMPFPLHPCPSVKSVVRRILTTDDTDLHGWGAAAWIQELSQTLVTSWKQSYPNPKIPLHPCSSVKSVVRNILTTDGTDEHGCIAVGFAQGCLGQMHKLFGDPMDDLIDELNEGLVA